MLLQDLEKYQEHPFTIFLEDQLLVGNFLLPNQNKQTSLINFEINFPTQEYVDGFGNKILQLGAIVKISETMIKRILARQTLQADEFVKFQVFLTEYF